MSEMSLSALTIFNSIFILLHLSRTHSQKMGCADVFDEQLQFSSIYYDFK